MFSIASAVSQALLGHNLPMYDSEAWFYNIAAGFLIPFFSVVAVVAVSWILHSQFMNIHEWNVRRCSQKEYLKSLQNQDNTILQ